MKRYLVPGAAIAAAAALLLVLPLGAGANSTKRFVLGLNGVLTGDTTGSGTFTVAGALTDNGGAQSSFTVTSQKGNCANLAGDNTFTAADGTFTMHLSGTNCFSSAPNDPRAIFDGRFTITGGTGVFHGLLGSGTITGEDDVNAGTFTSIYDGNVGHGH